MLFYYFCESCRPLLTRAPAGSLSLLRACCRRCLDNGAWDKAPTRYRLFYDHALQCYLVADLQDWKERSQYYSGQLLDATIPLLISSVLGPGDTFIDIGANIGLMSLAASQRVGPRGNVHSIEPNPRAIAFLNMHLAINGVTNCRVLPVALADVDDDQMLSTPVSHLAASTLRTVSGGQRTRVRVCRGDSCLSQATITGNCLVKVDVEGYEHRVVLGLRRILAGPAVVGVVMEVNPKWLVECGSSAAALFAEMVSLGCRPYRVRLNWRKQRPCGICLEPDSEVPDRQMDILFAKQNLTVNGLPVQSAEALV